MFQIVCRCEIKIKACSRTDSGVHANGQVANLFIPRETSLRKLYSSVNALLPDDIAIIDLVWVADDFSARKDNFGKRYIYQIISSPVQRVFNRDTYLWQRTRYDLSKMNAACNLFMGEHDFSAFRGRGCQQINTVKNISRLEIFEKKGRDLSEIGFIVEGSGFLKNMVRIMVGTLMEIGQGKSGSETILKAFQSGSRKDAGFMAPAKGLILDEVFYNPDPFMIGNRKTSE